MAMAPAGPAWGPMERRIRRAPRIKKPTEAASCSAWGGITLESEPPAAAPNKLASTKAKALPAKTAPGRLEVPLRLTIASWVLSPSSARNTVTKVEARRASMGGVQRQRTWR